jgi:hypothetical protein
LSVLAPAPSNTAAELGPSRFPWWKDWRGECVAIIASGCSAKAAKIDVLRNRIHVVAIKENVNLCPWADVVYGCDWPWWRHRRGLPDYKGLKLSYANQAHSHFADVHKVEIKDARLDKLMTDEPGTIGSGGNSAFQAVNIVVQFGVAAILAIGFDMHGRSGAHWYGRNNWDGGNNPSEQNYRRWIRAFNGIAPDLSARRIDMVNASPDSALVCFERKSIEQALRAWGL